MKNIGHDCGNTSDNNDPAAHFTELKVHFQLITTWPLAMKMGSALSDSRYRTIMMQSLPESYRPALQTITAAEKASSALATETAPAKKMKVEDLMTFFLEEAQHRS